MQTSRILLLVSFIIALTCLSFNTAHYKQTFNQFIVVLDAGHGGGDPGNLGSGYKEKDIALKIVLEIGKQLEKHPDIKVIYTRKKDVFIDLDVRGAIANRAQADLFVSVHCNSHNSAAHGTETFVLGTHRNKTNFEVAKKENSVIFKEHGYKEKYGDFNPNSPESSLALSVAQEEYLDQSIMLAGLIQNKFTKILKRKNRGVKQAGFIVLHQTVMPSVLVEAGFLTYKKEGAYLNSKKGQQEISQSIAKAILEYKASLDKNTGSYIPEVDNNPKPKTAAASNIVYKVQVSASSKALKTKPYNFKGLKGVSRIKEGRLYKYFYGQTSNYDKTEVLKQEAVSKGYKSSFIVAFKDGKKIALIDALKTTAN